MPDVTALTGTLPLPLWMALALLALLLAVIVIAIRRSGSPGSMAALFGVPALVVVAWAAWNFADRQRVAEREALDARAVQLAAAAMAPGSALACLDGGLDDAVIASCEAALFRTPEVVAAATVYTAARLRLLADGYQYAAHRGDNGYFGVLYPLQVNLEADRYGFVAHVLMTRDGCTADSCVAFGWILRDPGPVKANMEARKLAATVARYAVSWNGGAPAVAAVVAPAPAPLATTLSPIPGSPVPVTKPIDYPTAASIPPVSIMTEPSAAAAAAPSAAPAARRPAAAANPAARQQ